MGRTPVQYNEPQLPRSTRTSVDLQRDVRDFFVDAQERLVDGSFGSCVTMLAAQANRAQEYNPSRDASSAAIAIDLVQHSLPNLTNL